MNINYDLECPYCGAGNEVCLDGQGYEEEINHEMMCESCKKNFTFQTSVSFYYEPSRADCLNGGQHELFELPSNEYNTRGVIYFDRCKNCNYKSTYRDNP